MGPIKKKTLPGFSMIESFTTIMAMRMRA